MIRNLFGGSKCRTVDRCDIFGDGSGVALYRLDGNANDESGNYHGTEVGTPIYGGGRFERGIVSSNTNTNYVSTAAIPTGSAKTFSVWIKPTALPIDATYHIVYSAYNAGFNQGLFIKFISAGIYSIDFYINIGGSRYSIATPPQTELLLGNWINLVGVLESDNTLSIYKNAISLVSRATATINAVAYYGVLKFGQYLTDGTYNAYTFKGSIDQVRIFNRAITATEVATLYAECAPTSTVDDINPFLDGSLKALYQFNGDVTDKTGVYNGTATNVTYGTGTFGQCAVFNGTALISTTFALSANVFSYSGWFKVTTPSSTIQSLVDFTTNRAMLSSGNGTNAYVSYYDGGTYRTFSTYTLPANTLVFLSLVINGTTAYLYADGILKGTSACTAVIPSGGMYMGRYAGSASGFLTGSIDQLRIFNKALTPMEVASLYTETTPLEEPMHSLVDPFKDGSGKALYRLDGNALDESGNYNGTATNMVWSAGRFGRCGVFNGSSSVITSATYPSFIVANAPHTVSMWLTNADIVNVRVAMVLQYNNIVINYSSGNTLTVSTWQSGAGVGLFTTISMPSTTNLFHLVKTYDGVNINIYIDSVLQTPLSTISSTSGSTGLVLGRNSSAENYWSGTIDQVRIFNRALTVGEVTTLYTEI